MMTTTVHIWCVNPLHPGPCNNQTASTRMHEFHPGHPNQKIHGRKGGIKKATGTVKKAAKAAKKAAPASQPVSAWGVPIADTTPRKAAPATKRAPRKAANPPLSDTSSPLAQSINSGVRDERALGGGASAQVDRVAFEDGTQAIRKKAGNTRRLIESPQAGGGSLTAIEQQDAEELAAQIATAIGVRAPAVQRISEDEAYFEFIDGHSGMEIPFDSQFADLDVRTLGRSDEGILLGFLDTITDNADRHEGNWMLDRDRNLVAIDHGHAFQPPPSYIDVNFGDDMFGANFHTRGDWNDTNPMSPADIATARQRIEALRPEFERLNREDWLELVLERIDEVGQRATGTKRRL